MTIVLFQLSDGSTLRGGEDSDDIDEDHPIFFTGFVRGLMENHHDADEELSIPLPKFITRNDLIRLCNYLFHYSLSDEPVGFGKHSNMTFRQVTEEEPGYIRWTKSLPDPGEKMSCLLRWVNSIDRYQKVWSEHGRDINRIAKYFQDDLCKGCGCMGTVRNGTESSSEFDSDDDSEIEGVELYPCHRTKWPNVTPIPSYEKAMKNINPLDSRERHRV